MSTQKLSATQLATYRRRLANLHGRLTVDVQNIEQEIATNQDSLVEREAYFADEIETDIVLGENDESILANVNAALNRIEKGTFGLCCECGIQIGTTRLSAIPYTCFCIQCERRHETANV